MINIEYQLAKKEILYISDVNISFLKSSIAVLFCKSIDNTKANLQLSFSDVEDYRLHYYKRYHEQSRVDLV